MGELIAGSGDQTAWAGEWNTKKVGNKTIRKIAKGILLFAIFSPFLMELRSITRSGS
jgi:hypothetical protein